MKPAHAPRWFRSRIGPPLVEARASAANAGTAPMSDHLLPIPWLDVVLILALIAVNGVLAMSELAIVSSREARLKAMAKSGSRGAKCALDLAADPGRFLSTVQSGITLIGDSCRRIFGRQPGRAGGAAARSCSGIDPETAQTSASAS